MERNQNFDPFKFIIYSAKAGEQLAAPNQWWNAWRDLRQRAPRSR